MKSFQGTVTFLADTCPVNIQGVPEDSRVRRKLGSVFQDFFER